MDKFVDTAKKLTKSVVPNNVLDSLRERIPSDHSSSSRQDDVLTFDWLTRSVAERGLDSYFVITPERGKASLCAPAESYPLLIDAMIAVCDEANVEIGYMSKRQRIVISDRAELSQELISKPFAHLRLISQDKVLALFVEKWQVDGSTLVAPRPNLVTKHIQLTSPSAVEFLRTPGKHLRDLFTAPLVEVCDFDVDVVYTWVDSDDPEWRASFETFSSSSTRPVIEGAPSTGDRDSDRFVSRDELRHSLRSLLQFAPWVRNVYIVSNCRPPEWFDATNERVRWVDHADILDAQFLPTFNSHAIETSIHRIPELSEHFLYFNDDLFVMQPVNKSDFFVPNGLAKIRPEPYGIVHGQVDPDDPDYINAARNGQALLQSKFAKTATRPHTHSPQSMKRSVAHACEAAFPEAFETTRSNRFRSITDVSPTSFLYPHFAYLTGEAVMDFPDTALLNANHPYRERLASYASLLNAKDFAALPLTLCINDGGGSTTNDDWGQAIEEFMSTAFAYPSEAEREH